MKKRLNLCRADYFVSYEGVQKARKTANYLALVE